MSKKYTLGLTDNAVQVLAEVSVKIGRTKADVLRLGLGFLAAAVNLKLKGKSLVVVEYTKRKPIKVKKVTALVI